MRWTSAALIAIAVIAALTLVHHPAGLGLTAVLSAVYATTARRSAWWLLAAALAAVATLRSAAWVVVPSIAASLAVASYAASGGASWRQVGLGLVRIGRRPAVGVTVLRRAPVSAGAVAIRTTAIAVVLVAVFLPLFATADAAFAHLLDVAVPVESADRPLTRALLFFGLVTLGGALIHAEAARPAHATSRRLERVELAVPLGILVGLFAVFVAFQLTTLYGGNDYVLAAGSSKTHGWLPRGVLALSAIGMLGFAFSNPDGRIAEHNLDRYDRTGRIDRDALRDLSPDATPVLERMGLGECPEPDPIVSLNLGRTRARAACAG